MLDRRLDADTLFVQAVFEPTQCRCRARVLVAHAFGQLGREHLGKRTGRARGDIRLQCRTSVPWREQTLGQGIGIGTGYAPGTDLLGQAPQVLDQDDAQGNRYRPQLANSQRLDPLVGMDVALQQFNIEVAVGVRHEGPGQPEDARVAGERPIGQLGQLPVVARRQVVVDLADLLFDNVVIVQQPLGSRYHTIAPFQLDSASPVGSQQDTGVVIQAHMQRQYTLWRIRHLLCQGQALRVLFEPFDAEEFFSNRCQTVPGRL
ncbi:hypothetical protein [Pseudomonas sp. PDM21]|uniref:hypothetical protein n=1 Tax=Pseudomonas sp. PDM21 TaxID=2769257 RepID=UPI001CE02ED3|nr:hypothetical protein [Pseudomonas sp. PDM21]